MAAGSLPHTAAAGRAGRRRAVAEAVLNGGRLKTKNALTLPMLQRLGGIAGELAGERDTRAVVHATFCRTWRFRSVRPMPIEVFR